MSTKQNGLRVSGTIITLVCAWLCAQQVSAQEVRKVALLIGVEEYQKRGFSNLNYAEDDMTALEAALKQQGFEVTMLLGSRSGMAKATRQNVVNAINKSFIPRLKQLNKQDTSLIALAGHGRHRAVNQSGVLTEDHFYCPADAHDTDSSTWLSISTLIKTVENESSCETNLILIDACRDNPGRGRGVDGKGMSLNRDAVAVMFASSYNEQAYEPDELKHGLFTYYVLEALAGGAKNFDNEVTWDSMVDFVKGRVESRSEELKAANKISGIQRPNSMGNLRGKSPVLARVGGVNFAMTHAEFAELYLEFSRIRYASTEMRFEDKLAQISSRIRGTSFELAVRALHLDNQGNREANVLDSISSLHQIANRIDPGSQHTHLLNAIYLRMQGQTDAAATAFRLATQTNPLLVDAYLGLVWLESEDRLDQLSGMELARSLIAKFPNDYRVYNAYGTRLFNSGEYAKGLLEIEKAIRLDPSNPLLWNNKGYGLSGNQNIEDSLAAYRQAGELAWSRDAWILANVADAFLAQKNPQTAQKYAVQATKLDPHLDSPWITLAQILYEANDIQGAINKISEGIGKRTSTKLLARRTNLYIASNNLSKAAEDVIRVEVLSNNDITQWGEPKFRLLYAQGQLGAALALADQMIAEARNRNMRDSDIQRLIQLKNSMVNR